MKYRFRHHPSKLSTLAITFGAGSRVEFNIDYPFGIAHFMEHVRFKGTEEKTAKDILKETAHAGGYLNAWTSENLVSYHMTIPEENIKTAFECLSDIIMRPVFPKEELQKEKEVVCQEIRTYNDDITELVHNKVIESIFDNSMSKPVIGTEESVKSITRDHILAFDKEFYSNEHALITLVSNTDHIDLVEKYFIAPDDVLLYMPASKNIKYGKSSSHVVHKEAQLQNHISICFSGKEIEDLVESDRAKVKVFSEIFGRGDTSRLFTTVREDLGLVYGISAYTSHNMDGTFYELYTITEPENQDKVIDAIEKEIKIIKESLPLEEELQRAKNVIRSSLYMANDTSNGVNYQMVFEEFFNYKSGSEFLSKIDSVTAKDVQEVANIILNSNKYTVIGTN